MHAFTTSLHIIYHIACRSPYLQHDQVGEVAEGIVGDVADAIEGQGHGLQGGQVIEGTHWDLRQSVVIQPEMPEGPKAREGLWGDLHYQVGI